VVLHRVRRVVAVGGVVGVVAEEVDGLLSLEVHDAERLPRCDDPGPVVVGGDHRVLQGLAEGSWAKAPGVLPARRGRLYVCELLTTLTDFRSASFSVVITAVTIHP